MAGDKETSKKKRKKKATEKEQAEGGRGGVEKPVSLYPLTFDEAVGELLKVSPEPRRGKKGR